MLSSDWSDAGVLIPYRIYKRYGDKKILESSYAAMKKYADFKIKTLGKRYPTAIRTGIDRKYKKYISNYGQSYGEWAEPAEVHITGFKDFACPLDLLAKKHVIKFYRTITRLSLYSYLTRSSGERRTSDFLSFERSKSGTRSVRVIGSGEGISPAAKASAPITGADERNAPRRYSRLE